VLLQALDCCLGRVPLQAQLKQLLLLLVAVLWLLGRRLLLLLALQGG
jgi:hypothetical protein